MGLWEVECDWTLDDQLENQQEWKHLWISEQQELEELFHDLVVTTLH